MANLLEAYKNRLAISESVYSKAHNGEKMDNHRKLVTARCLQNINTYMTEAFDNSVGVQRSDMGMFKKFALNLTTVALPNLIANDLVLVHPMTSMSGYINYISYTAGSNKGDVSNGIDENGNYVQGSETELYSPFRIHKAHSDYTSSKVTVKGEATGADVALKWSPVIPGSISIELVQAGEDSSETVKLIDDGNGSLRKLTSDIQVVERTDRNGNVIVEFVDAEGKVVTVADLEKFDGATVKYGTTRDDRYNAQNIPASISGLTGEYTLTYLYNNVYIPQNDIPLLNAKMEAIPLVARARRIAIYYSQIAAFQAKTDYGFDLGDQLAERAVGELSYEIDTEVIELLYKTAQKNTPAEYVAALAWSKELPIGVSKAEHYAGFAEVVGIASQLIYDRTRKFAPNYIVIASNILPILAFVPNFKAAPAGNINGPYFAGTLNSLKVYVSPALQSGDFFVGVNGDDMMTSAAVYAPYMPIVPTQLLQYADGGTSQGFSTLYDLKILNKDLLLYGHVEAGNVKYTAGTQSNPVYIQNA